MKTIIISSCIALSCIGLNASAQIQQQPTRILKSIGTSPLRWYSTSKINFIKAQKLVPSSTVMARKIVPGGLLEIGPGLAETAPQEKIKGTVNKTSQDGKIICKATTKEMDLTIKPEFNIIKASSQNKIFPGIIFTSESILDESFIIPSGLPARKPMTLNLNILGSRNAAVELTTPGVIQMDRINTLINQNQGLSIPAMDGLSITEVDSKFEFASQVETSSGLFLPLEEFSIPAEVNAGTAFSGNVSGETKRKTYLVKYIQPMFMVFHNDLNAANLFQDPAAAASRGNLVMINSVTYGRMVFIKVVSEETAGKVKTALEAKLGIELTELNVKAGNSVEGSASVNFSSVIKDFKAIVIGGNGASAGRVLNNPDQLKSYIDDPTARILGSTTNPFPISYTLVRVSDYASLGIRSVGTFEAQEECKTLDRYSIYIKNFGVQKVVDNPVTGNNEDLFGNITVQVFTKNASGAEVELTEELGRPSKVWDQSSANPLQLKEGEYKQLYVSGNSPVKEGLRRFMLTPDQAANGYLIIKYRIKDKIMKDGEDLGNSNASVSYEEKDFKFFFRDWQDLKDVSGCTAVLKEIGGDAKICINFSMYRE